MVNRVSALEGHYNPRRYGKEGSVGVTMTEVRDLTLYQVAGWVDTMAAVSKKAAKTVGAKDAPGPCSASRGSSGALLRVEPMKWWVYGAEAPALKEDEGATLDMSHSRTHIRLTGQDVTTLLNRHLPINLSDEAFPVGAVASTAFHHVGVTLWHSDDGYELFVPRGFALSLWEMLEEGAAQFGAEIV
jgi:heterotetrameric sarcosine oxidase gamma subunit